MAGMLLAAAAAALTLWSVHVKQIGVSNDVLGYVAVGGVCFSYLLFHVFACKVELAQSRETQQTASDLV